MKAFRQLSIGLTAALAIAVGGTAYAWPLDTLHAAWADIIGPLMDS